MCCLVCVVPETTDFPVVCLLKDSVKIRMHLLCVDSRVHSALKFTSIMYVIVCITLKEQLDMGQNPCSFGTHQDAIAGYVQQKSCRIWNVGGYRRGNPLLHAGISMTKISKTLQLSGGFKWGHN